MLKTSEVAGYFTATLQTPLHTHTHTHTSTHTSMSNYPSPPYTHLAIHTCFSRWVWRVMESGWRQAAVFILVPSAGGRSAVFVQGSTITAVSGLRLATIHVYFTFLLRISSRSLISCSSAAEQMFSYCFHIKSLILIY